MKQRDAIRRVLARLRELDEAVDAVRVEDHRSPTHYSIARLKVVIPLDRYNARITPLLAALAQAVVEAPRYAMHDRHDGLDEDEDGDLIDRTEAIDAALDALAKEADRA